MWENPEGDVGALGDCQPEQASNTSTSSLYHYLRSKNINKTQTTTEISCLSALFEKDLWSMFTFLPSPSLNVSVLVNSSQI